jgi:hypothetical protein
MTIQSPIAPGARILCRDAEWLVKSTSRSTDGGRVIEAIGVSEFIRGRAVRFIEGLETVEVLQPEHTDLVPDRSHGYAHSLLFIESHLRQTVPEDGKIYVGQQAAMDVMNYQLYPAYKSLSAPQIRYLLTRSQLERMDEVERIIKVLLNKDEQAIKNIGDPSVFMGVFDAQAEEEYTAKTIESGVSAVEFEAQLETNAAKGGDFDIFAWFENPNDASLTAAEEEASSTMVEQGQSLSLYPSTYEYAATALQACETPIPNLNIQRDRRSIELQIPAELERRYRRLPPEIRPSDKQLLQLSDRPSEIMQAWEESRRLEASFPQQQYLWDLHPLVEWLKDRGLFRFGRHQAPVIELSSGLAAGEAIFILWGSFANQRGKTLMNRWLGVVFNGSKFDRIETLDITLQRTQLGKTEIPNSGELNPLLVEALAKLRAEAVRQSIAYLSHSRQEFLAYLTPQLEAQRDRLSRLKGNHSRQLQLKFDQEAHPTTLKEQHRHQEEQRLDRLFQDYEHWVDLSMTIEQDPYLKLVAVLWGI